MAKSDPDIEQLRRENEELRRRLEEATETLEAIRSGEVDAVVVKKGTDNQVFTLEGAERPYRLFVEEMQQGALTLGAQGTILFCNQRLAQMLKIQHSQVLGDVFENYVAPSGRKAWQALIRRAANERAAGEVELNRTDGSGLPAFITINRLCAPQTVFCIVVADLTEQKQFERVLAAEAELRSSREWLQVTLKSIGDAVITTDQSGNITFLNPVAIALTGWALEEAMGKPIQTVFRVINEMSLRPADDIVARVLREGTIFTLANHTALITKAGQTIPVEDSAAPIKDSAGNVAGAVVVFHDVTGKRRAEEAMAHAKTAAENASAQKDYFLAVLGHELRNPLGPIRNSVALMKRTGSNDPILQRTREIIDRQVTHMTRLIDDLLDVSRIASGKIILRKEEMNLTAVVLSVVEDHRPLLEANGLQLEFAAATEPLRAFGDPARIAQILSNLLVNANKFSDRGGRITVGLRKEVNNVAVISVRDTGVGMDQTTLSRIFEPFVQADGSLDRSRGGLGLGLALVKGLAGLHGGQVEARSAGPGQGSEFVVTLPILIQDPANGTATQSESRPSVPARRILVIEDNQDAAETLRMLLEMGGHNVAVAHCGREGLEKAQSHLPEVVLCDIGLPGDMDGHAVAKAIRAHPKLRSAYLIAMTGYGQDEDRKRAKQAGFDHHLTKPADPEALERLLAR
ncbi:MAG TPA: PAS domain S-box protein [Planctomycetota bacterium]|jgi:PAS domain S-box-containing protein